MMRSNWSSFSWNSSRVGKAISELIDRRAVLLLGRAQNREMNEVHRGVGFQHVAPGALAGMRLARDEQHAQVFAHAFDRQHGAIVDGRELAFGGLGFDFDDVGTGVLDVDRDLDLLAETHALRRGRLALIGDGELDRFARLRRRRIGDLDLDVLAAADDAERARLRPRACGRIRLACRLEARAPAPSKPSPAAEAGTSCTSPSVIMTTPASRSGGTSKRLGEIGEEHGAVALAVGRGRGRASAYRD